MFLRFLGIQIFRPPRVMLNHFTPNLTVRNFDYKTIQVFRHDLPYHNFLLLSKSKARSLVTRIEPFFHTD